MNKLSILILLPAIFITACGGTAYGGQSKSGPVVPAQTYVTPNATQPAPNQAPGLAAPGASNSVPSSSIQPAQSVTPVPNSTTPPVNSTPGTAGVVNDLATPAGPLGPGASGVPRTPGQGAGEQVQLRPAIAAPRKSTVESFFQCAPVSHQGNAWNNDRFTNPKTRSERQSDQKAVHKAGRVLLRVLDNIGIPIPTGSEPDLDPSISRESAMPPSAVPPPTLKNMDKAPVSAGTLGESQRSSAEAKPAQTIPTSELEGTMYDTQPK